MSTQTLQTPSEETDPFETGSTMKIQLSAELHIRATEICKMRNCSLEAVIEELLDRFLPPPGVNDVVGSLEFASSSMYNGEMNVPWSRWIFRRLK